LAQARIDPRSIVGGLVSSVPTVGQQLLVRKGELSLNVGQVTRCEYENGNGTGFCIRATRINHDPTQPGETVYVKLEDPRLAIPLHWS